ncbi:acyltransferase family protein [Acidovorax citrulli]|nr:acyltransferase family protein [Paracidovorax citrulli]
MPSPPSRNTLIDSVKGIACATIVAHHLAFYGPMSEVAQPLMPGLIAWLADYGRMAVQVFLVLGGYLAAGRLAAAGGPRWNGTAPEIGRRFVRLAVPYAVALVLAVLAAAAVRPWLKHPSVPAEPSLPQLLANALMLQDIAGQEALSAGVWYVAIDFQLFVLSALLVAAARHGARVLPVRARGCTQPAARVAVAAATALSLWELNRHPSLDAWAVYFFGAYGLGMMARWAVAAPRGSRAAGAWLVLIGLWARWRWRWISGSASRWHGARDSGWWCCCAGRRAARCCSEPACPRRIGRSPPGAMDWHGSAAFPTRYSWCTFLCVCWSMRPSPRLGPVRLP